jgi:hypothetical protein
VSLWRRVVLPFGVALAVSGPFAFAQVSESDLGWHLAVGRLASQVGGVLTRNGLSWTYPNYPCRSTSWLFDHLAWFAFAHGGLVAVQLLTFFLVALTLAGVLAASHSANPTEGTWVTPGVAALLLPRLTPRAFLCSWVVLAWVIALGTIGRRRGWKLRALCIPLIALGSNFHSGAVFGAVALGTFCLEAAVRERRWVREVSLAAAGVLALIANPGGPSNVLYATSHLWLYEALKISELQAPRILDLPAFYVLLPVSLGLAWQQRRAAPGDLLRVAGFGLGGLWTARIAFDFYLVAAPVVASALGWFRVEQGRRAQRLLVALLVTVCVASNLQRAFQLRLGPHWDAAALPVRAADAIRNLGLSGPFFNTFSDGGYLAFVLPDRPVFQDGRTQAYPHELFARITQADQSPEAFGAFLRSMRVEWAVTQTQDRLGAGSRLVERPDWALVYWDELNEILIRRDVPLWHQTVGLFEFRYFHPLRTQPEGISEEIAHLPRPALERYLSEVDRFLESTPDNRFALLARCALRTRLGAESAPQACASARSASAGEGDLLQLVERASRLSSLR